MSDLISRSELLNAFNNTNVQITFDLPVEDVYARLVQDAVQANNKMVIDTIKNQPTAYSANKVVEELELHSFELGTDTLPAHYVRLNEAIEIVKQGGVSDDTDNMCEWRLCDEEANVYDTSCRNPHILIEGTPQENNYEYCPYCGKKIKIVGD